MALHVQCDNCGGWGITSNNAAPDAAAQCRTPADDPPGSPDGSCCTVHTSHDDHAQAVAGSGDSSCRPVTITVMAGEVGG